MASTYSPPRSLLTTSIPGCSLSHPRKGVRASARKRVSAKYLTAARAPSPRRGPSYSRYAGRRVTLAVSADYYERERLTTRPIRPASAINTATGIRSPIPPVSGSKPVTPESAAACSPSSLDGEA